MKKIKKVKTYFIVFCILVIGIFMIYLFYQKDISIKKAFKEQEMAFIQHKIDKEIVIKSLKRNYQIVGLEGEINKEFGYQDKLFDAGWDWVEKMGERSYTTSIEGTFKMGFNTDEIKKDHIFIEGETIKIISPQVVLISLELPYDKMQIKEHVGILRRDFTEDEKQYIYKEAKEKIKSEILQDEGILKRAKTETQTHIKNLLLNLTGIEKVEFIDI